MNNQQVLQQLCADLRRQLEAINASPIIPGSVKLAVDTTFQILDILVSESISHG